MSLTIELAPEIEAALREMAAEHGHDPARIAEAIIKNAVFNTATAQAEAKALPAATPAQPIMPEQKAQAFLE